MKRIPFYPNDKDNMHCMVSCYRMLFDYFLSQKVSQTDMETYVGFHEGRAAWTIIPNTKMAKQGFDIRMLEPFDYKAYAEQGDAYLDRIFSPEKAAWLREHSNVGDMRSYIPDFTRIVNHKSKRATLHDIDIMLAENRLVFVTLNARRLNNEEGYVEHAVLILQRDGQSYIIHDPGLPAESYRHVSRELLWQAMGGEKHTSEVTGFIYRRGIVLKRLDMHVLAQKPRLSRAFAAKLIEQGKVLVNGQLKKPGYKVQETDEVTIDYDESELDNIPQIDLPVLYEDDYCIVINKPAGVLTHAQGKLINEATVATFVRTKVSGMQGERAGIVHRLDRATSGVIIIAKNAVALAHFQKQFADRTTQKTYIAVVEGELKQKLAVIDMPIERNPKAPATFRVGPNGKQAATQYMVLDESAKGSLVELKPKTGRTHQLRVHMAQLGHPIVGDPLYGSGHHGDRLYLHAKSLELELPDGERKTFTAPVPPEFEEYLR
jgi:RluA family pseudouridine synthase